MNRIKAIFNWVANFGGVLDNKITIYKRVAYYLIFAVVCCMFVLKFNFTNFNPARYSIIPIRQDKLVDNVTVKIVFYLPPNLFADQEKGPSIIVNKMNAYGSGSCKKRCEWTMDSTMISKADAVVFFFFSIGFTRKDLPKGVRNPNQIWAVFEREAPPKSSCLMENLSGVFNWTINYRKDSDIFGPYGRKTSKTNDPNQAAITFGNLTLDQWIAGKENVATIVVSNCYTGSKREVLIEQLKQAGLPVDIYGKCGKQLCARYMQNCDKFWEDDISKRYKFYLAFENSICTDYITEKFWRSLKLGMVPVVYGGGDYLEDAPPNSFIDVRSFSSAEKLTQYLLKLDKEPEEYKKFFEWKNKFKIIQDGNEWCQVCEALHQQKTLKKSSKVIDDLNAWYWQIDPQSHNKTACENNPKFFKSF